MAWIVHMVCCETSTITQDTRGEIMKRRIYPLLMVGLLSSTVLNLAFAADDQAESPVKFYGHIEGGITLNPDDPSDQINFGQLFTDKANRPLLNQVMLAVEKPLDLASDLNFGFKAQGMYGSDARLTHFLGELDDTINDRNQLDIVELYASAHTSLIGAGGMDIKVGQFVTLEGAEVIDPNGNFFYSHSYIFFFGIPFKHTGIMTTTHASGMLDVYLGVTTGVNTSLGSGDNNDALSFHGGIGLNGLMDGKVSILASTHIGPENPGGTSGIRPNKDLRYLNDITIIAKVNDRLTLTTDLNYIYDEGFKANGYGIAQYATYALSDAWSIGARSEIWHDDDGFFVAAFPGPLDFLNLQKGLPATVIGYGPATYGALTLGANYKPVASIGLVDGIAIRPEIRYDHTLNGARPYDVGTSKGQFTAAVDVIVRF